jgi:FkbM family methyltransferase
MCDRGLAEHFRDAATECRQERLLASQALSQGGVRCPGQLSIFLGPAANRGSTTTISSVATRKGQAREAEVPADTLSAIIGEADLLGARLIKIDIEGAEYLLFSGIAHLMPRFSSTTEWLIEISPKAIAEQGRSAVDLLEMFRSSGYELYKIRNDYKDESYFTDRPALTWRILAAFRQKQSIYWPDGRGSRRRVCPRPFLFASQNVTT